MIHGMPQLGSSKYRFRSGARVREDDRYLGAAGVVEPQMVGGFDFYFDDGFSH